MAALDRNAWGLIVFAALTPFLASAQSRNEPLEIVFQEGPIIPETAKLAIQRVVVSKGKVDDAVLGLEKVGFRMGPYGPKWDPELKLGPKILRPPPNLNNKSKKRAEKAPLNKAPLRGNPGPSDNESKNTSRIIERIYPSNPIQKTPKILDVYHPNPTERKWVEVAPGMAYTAYIPSTNENSLFVAVKNNWLIWSNDKAYL
jgi:hypothetical protein